MFSYVERHTRAMPPKRRRKYVGLYVALVLVSLAVVFLLYFLAGPPWAVGLLLVGSFVLATHDYFYHGCRWPRIIVAYVRRWGDEAQMRGLGVCPKHGKGHLEMRERPLLPADPCQRMVSAPFCTVCGFFVDGNSTQIPVEPMGGLLDDHPIG